MARAALLKPAEVSERFGIPTATLRWWRATNQGPSFVRLSERIFRYPVDGVETFVAARTYDPSVRAAQESHATRKSS